MSLSHDPRWPRAAAILRVDNSSESDVGFIGIPAALTSISKTGADQTPTAVRNALQRYSLGHHNPQVDMSRVAVKDYGDLHSPDVDESKTIDGMRTVCADSKFCIAIGGDNSVTYSGFIGSGATGLITFDAHLDLRDGVNNGSPVRRLIEAGLSGKKVVQIGIADFSNSPEYLQRARDYGVTVIPRSELRERRPGDIWSQAISIAGKDVYVDFDLDVCDRSVVPACPAAAPGGLSADEIRQFAYLVGASHSVLAMDITEVDATRDSADERTVRLAALVVLEAIAGYSTRS